MSRIYQQQDQPAGVPPLALTGERTLPDVADENYWFRRHLAVYEWVALRVADQDVIDMACGEGYGAAVLARLARSVIGVEANLEAFEHARLRYRAPHLRFVRDMVERFAAPADAIVLLQTIEHLHEPDLVLERFAANLRPGGVAYISTPNVLTLAPQGAERSGNPWHLREYRAEEFRTLCQAHFPHVQLLGLFHARKLRLHDVALRLGWDAIHARLGLTKAFYGRFVPAITSADFALRAERRLHRALDFLAVCRT